MGTFLIMLIAVGSIPLKVKKIIWNVPII